jgi:hypothetical protein
MFVDKILFPAKQRSNLALLLLHKSFLFVMSKKQDREFTYMSE